MSDSLPPSNSNESVSVSVQTSSATAGHASSGEKHSGIALCLSGGGFRAALFHLGALRRLNETGVLSQIDIITSVSGGSIIAAHLSKVVDPWPQKGDRFLEWDRIVSAPFRAFTARDLRTSIIFCCWKPKNWIRSSARAEALAKAFEHLTSATLSELPDHPRFVFCATDVAFGTNWIFEKARVGAWRAGYIRPAPPWPLARAVAASSCFPPIFSPLPLNVCPKELKGGSFRRGPERDNLISKLRLSDGGIYDNLGLEPAWGRYDTMLVSNGGATLPFQEGRGLISLLRRYVAITMNQVSSLRVRWLIDRYASQQLKGAYWSIASSPSSYNLKSKSAFNYQGYSSLLVQEIISVIRTDLDAFTEAEAAVLENHGYWMTEAALQRRAPNLLASANQTVAQAPHPDWMDEDRVRQTLKDSSKRKLFGYSIPF